MAISLETFNQLSTQACEQHLMQCCTSQVWVHKLAAERPFASIADVKQSADRCWQGLDEADYLQAFEGHPKIGDVNSLKAKYANTKALASGEQSGVAQASDEVIEALSRDNQLYLDRFGFIFIVFASGKSAQQMLELLQGRLHNDRATELKNAAEQQRLIFQLRIDHLIVASD